MKYTYFIICNTVPKIRHYNPSWFGYVSQLIGHRFREFNLRKFRLTFALNIFIFIWLQLHGPASQQWAIIFIFISKVLQRWMVWDNCKFQALWTYGINTWNSHLCFFTINYLYQYTASFPTFDLAGSKIIAIKIWRLKNWCRYQCPFLSLKCFIRLFF